MIAEARRRAYLSAMQVAVWVPRTALPFAAPARQALLHAGPAPEAAVPLGRRTAAAALREALPAPAPARAPAAAPPVASAVARPAPEAPRFVLQLLRAGDCLILLELPTGEPFQARDPAYLLLKDLLRAAGLPPSPRQVGDGEPIRWPLRGLDASASAARDYVQEVLASAVEQGGSRCVWLLGRLAMRFGGALEAEACYREVQIDGVGAAWALPGLEALMEAPGRKAATWRAMRGVMQRWTAGGA